MISVVQKRLRAFLNHFFTRKGLQRLNAVYRLDFSCENGEPESPQTFRLPIYNKIPYFMRRAKRSAF